MILLFKFFTATCHLLVGDNARRSYASSEITISDQEVSRDPIVVVDDDCVGTDLMTVVVTVMRLLMVLVVMNCKKKLDNLIVLKE